MPHYGISYRELADKILAGKKELTIRKKSKRPTVQGDYLSLTYGKRGQKGKREMLYQGKVSSVHSILITTTGVFVDGKLLTEESLLQIVKLDGFATIEAFMVTHQRLGNINRTDLEIIYWGVFLTLTIKP